VAFADGFVLLAEHAPALTILGALNSALLGGAHTAIRRGPSFAPIHMRLTALEATGFAVVQRA
jgi:hypothetical protein